jgi:tetratricopeptide (TPR) repeat protein
MYPDNATFYDAMADVYEQKKLFAEAFAARAQVLKLRKDPTAGTLEEAYKRLGYRGFLRRKVAIMEQTPQLQIDATEVAHQYALLDDEAHAMTWLERAYDQRNGEVLFLRTAPELDSIRSSPRFRDLVRRIGFPQPPSDKQ